MISTGRIPKHNELGAAATGMKEVHAIPIAITKAHAMALRIPTAAHSSSATTTIAYIYHGGIAGVEAEKQSSIVAHCSPTHSAEGARYFISRVRRLARTHQGEWGQDRSLIAVAQETSVWSTVMSVLFSPINLRSLTLPNRIVVSPICSGSGLILNGFMLGSRMNTSGHHLGLLSSLQKISSCERTTCLLDQPSIAKVSKIDD
jgi:hypothetical protein